VKTRLWESNKSVVLLDCSVCFSGVLPRSYYL